MWVGRTTRAAAALLVAVTVGAGDAGAAASLHGVSGPRALQTVDLSGRWAFTPKGGAPTTIAVPGGGWVKQGFDRVAEASYERRVAVPAEARGQVTQLVLGAVNHEATLFVDGRKVATNLTSFTLSTFDLTEHVRPGATHTLRLDVKGREALLGDERPATPTLPGVPTGVIGSGYTVPDAGSWSEAIPQGIFGPAPELRILPPVHIADAFVRPSVSQRALHYDVWIKNAARERRTVRLSGELAPAPGARDWRYPAIPGETVTIDAGKTEKVTVGPVRWDLGRDSYWWPNVPYRPGYRAQLHDLELRLSAPGPDGAASTAGGRVGVAGRPGVAGRSRLGLPSTRTCLSRRRFAIRLRRGLRSARVRVGGRRARVRRQRGRLIASVDLRGVRAARVTVSVRAVTDRGLRIRESRRYRTCMKRAQPRARAAQAQRDGHRALYRFGFRESRQVGTHYELNGVRVNFRGDSLTGGIYDRIDHGGKGDAFHTFPGFLPASKTSGGWPQAVDNLQRLNYNVVRIHQEPASPYMLDVADERGLMLVDETAVRGSESKQDFIAGRANMLAHTRQLVERDRHHASILRWSQSNEPDANGRGEPPNFQLDLYRTIMATDPTRPVSVDVTSSWYEDMPDGNFSVYQHYLNENGSIGGYTDDVHPRKDRPFGRGEYVWPINNTPQGFMWFGTSAMHMRAKDASEIRPYSLAGSWGSVIPGVKTTSYLADNDLPPLYGEDNLPDPWSNEQIRRIQAGFNPVLVADTQYWEEHKQSDPSGSFPSAKPSTLRAGVPTTRKLVIFNDTFSGERVDVRWELLGEGGGSVARGAFSARVPLGGREVREITFTPSVSRSSKLVLVAEKDGREVFREEEQSFVVTP